MARDLVMPVDLNERTAQRLREARTRAGYTVPELAAFTGLSTSTIRRLETGQHGTTFRTIEFLALALGTSINWWCEDRA